MILSARPTVTQVSSIVFVWNLFCFEKWGWTDGRHVQKQWSLPAVTVGPPRGSINTNGSPQKYLCITAIFCHMRNEIYCPEKNYWCNNFLSDFKKKSVTFANNWKMSHWTTTATTEEIDCALKIRPHPPEICISKRRHLGKNFVKNYILLFKFH